MSSPTRPSSRSPSPSGAVSARRSRCWTSTSAASTVGNEPLNAFVHLDEGLARAAAERVDEQVVAGEDPGPLAGVPFGVKDLEDCEGMPTTHGSLLYKGRGPVPATPCMSPGCGRPGRCRSARPPRPSSARSTSPRPRRGASPATRGTRPARRGVQRRVGRRGGGRARAVRARRATAAGRPVSPPPSAGSSGSSPATAASRIPARPGRRRRCSARSPRPWPTLPATSTWSPAPTTSTARLCRRPRSATRTPSSRWTCRGLRARWSEDLGFAVVRPGGGRDRRAGGSRRSPRRPGSPSTSRPVTLTDPVRTWLSSGAMDTVARSSRTCGPASPTTSRCTHASRSSRPWTTHCPGSPARTCAARSWRRDVAALFADVDVVLCPTTAVPAFAAEGPPPDEIAGQARPARRGDGDAVHDARQPVLEPGDLGARRAHCRRPAGRTADHRPPPPRRDPPAPGPHPRTSPTLAPIRPSLTDGQPWSRRKRSTSSMRSAVVGRIGLVVVGRCRGAPRAGRRRRRSRRPPPPAR